MYSTMFPSNQITCQTPIVWMDHTIDMTLPKGKAEAMSVPNMPGTLGIEPFVWICFSILTNLMIHPKNHILDFEDKDTRLKIRILPKLLIYSYHWNIYSHAKRLTLASQKKETIVCATSYLDCSVVYELKELLRNNCMIAALLEPH